MEPNKSRSGPAWTLTVFVIIFSLVIGAIGEAIIEPTVARAVTGAETRANLALKALTSKSVTKVATAAAQAMPNPSPSSTSPTSTPTTIQGSSPTAPTQMANGDEPFVSVVKKAGPAVVTVVNQAPPIQTAFGQIGQPEALGSGVIIDKDGHIVTNNHVVAGGGSFQVIFANGQQKVPATLVGRDPVSDIAVLKVNVPVPAVATFGNSDDLQIGEQVVAIGSALGDFRNTVTHGIVSGLDRTLPADSGEALSGLIQTDAPINHGNSGGPLLNLQGQVIGINTAVVRSTGVGGDIAEGLGFAIPSNTVKQIADQLIQHGVVPRPFLGVTAGMISPPIASYYGLSVTHGALIQSVEAGSPADKAGLKAGDVITAVDGTTLDDTHSLANVLLAHKVGDSVQLSVTRGNQSLTLTATLGQRPLNS
ncbi:MAG TPA: trypsin-like peptidase domain-containing protein [Chloroflexota bacterium]|nr:trypsin-like peptidase domain-containing protein [Chloroflexota bacterium]